MWFDDWSGVIRVVLVGVASYVALVLLIRVSGKRSLAQMNAFDLVVTVALGSTLATILLTSDVAFVEGIAALVLLLALQVCVAVGVLWSPRLRKLVTASPSLLLLHGSVRQDQLRQSRVSQDDVDQAIRQSGYGTPSDIAAVILESDGKISVISEKSVGDGSSLADVEGWQQ